MINSDSLATWSTRQFRPAQQFFRWREAVDETHLAWDIASHRHSEFAANLRRQSLGGASVIECVCDPCAGKRREPEIARSGEGYYGVLLVAAGKEMLRQGGREAWLKAGDFVLWDSTRPIDFAVGERLHKITLLVPQRLLEATLPDAREFVAKTVSGASDRGALFANHLRGLARMRENVPQAILPRLMEATLDLFATAFVAETATDGTATQRAMLARIQSYVRGRLDDPTLNPEAVANAHGISVRQLHRIFAAASNVTLERWLWNERLARCRHDLTQPGEVAISKVAFKWGFSDAAHFSRAFRERYGLAPSDLRKAAMGRG